MTEQASTGPDDDDGGFDVPPAIATEVASWRRLFNKSPGDRDRGREYLRRAAAELRKLLATARTELTIDHFADVAAFAWGELHELGAVSGLDADETQEIFARSANGADGHPQPSPEPPPEPGPDPDPQPRESPPPSLNEIDASDRPAHIPPRPWLLGNVFCRGFLSSIIAPGGTGKSATRMAQLLSAATGRSLTGEHVFKRCRVLMISLEDDRMEVERRLEAACIHHNINRDDLKGWLFHASPKLAKIVEVDRNGVRRTGLLEKMIRDAISRTSSTSTPSSRHTTWTRTRRPTWTSCATSSPASPSRRASPSTHRTTQGRD